jgi:hypothetical protein
MAIILKANEVNLFVSSVLFVFWYHSLNILDTPHMYPHVSQIVHIKINTQFTFKLRKSHVQLGRIKLQHKTLPSDFRDFNRYFGANLVLCVVRI